MKNIVFAFSLMIPRAIAMLFTQCNGKTNAAPVTDDAVIVKTAAVTTTPYTPQLN